MRAQCASGLVSRPSAAYRAFLKSRQTARGQGPKAIRSVGGAGRNRACPRTVSPAAEHGPDPRRPQRGRSNEASFINKDSSNISIPVVYARPEHNISRANISKAALKVLYTLRDGGYEAYLVGGGVRDLLLGRKPKDFDVATDATPEQIRGCFRRCRLIGRRFVLAHVRVGREIVEVATFRAASGETGNLPHEERITIDGRVVRDNVYGTREEDAWRRDFSVNSLYYNIADFSVVDYTGGMADLRENRLRLIGEPERRFREDPVRMLRAVRFAAKLGFAMEAGAGSAIPKCREWLLEVSSARLFEEVVKLFLGGAAGRTFTLLRQYGLFGLLFPEIDACLEEEGDGLPAAAFIEQALANTDVRVRDEKPVTPAFLFAALLWPVVRREASLLRANGESDAQAIESAGAHAIARQAQRMSITRRCSLVTREIWEMQPRLLARRGRRALGLTTRLRFRAAYDFLLLRAQAGEPVQEHCDWWTRLLESEGEERDALLDAPSAPGRRRRRRRRKERPASLGVSASC